MGLPKNYLEIPGTYKCVAGVFRDELEDQFNMLRYLEAMSNDGDFETACLLFCMMKVSSYDTDTWGHETFDEATAELEGSKKVCVEIISLIDNKIEVMKADWKNGS